jgi:hypothetical protein
MSDIQRELQVVLDSIKENDFYGSFEVWGKNGIVAYVPKEAVLKEMAAKIEQVKLAFFLSDLVQELSNRREPVS